MKASLIRCKIDRLADAKQAKGQVQASRRQILSPRPRFPRLEVSLITNKTIGYDRISPENRKSSLIEPRGYGGKKLRKVCTTLVDVYAFNEDFFCNTSVKNLVECYLHDR